jgi:hypothetical protein
MVRCRDCGLVGVQPEDKGGAIELGRHFRETGVLPTRNFNVHHDALCFAQVVEFPPNDEPRKSVLDHERKCQKFIKWQPGLSPKEHIAMDIWERQHKRDAKNLLINGGMLFVGTAAAIAAWWGALYGPREKAPPPSPAPISNVQPPTGYVTVQPAAVTASQTPSLPPAARPAPKQADKAAKTR